MILKSKLQNKVYSEKFSSHSCFSSFYSLPLWVIILQHILIPDRASLSHFCILCLFKGLQVCLDILLVVLSIKLYKQLVPEFFFKSDSIFIEIAKEISFNVVFPAQNMTRFQFIQVSFCVCRSTYCSSQRFGMLVFKFMPSLFVSFFLFHYTF